MSARANLYTGPGWYRIFDNRPGMLPGSTRVVYIGPKADPWYGPDWLAVWATSDDRSAVIVEGMAATIVGKIVQRIETGASDAA